MKKISAIILLFLLGMSVTFLAQEEKLDKTPFPIGGIEAIAKQVKYPAEAKEQNIQGKVLIEALIDKNGKVKSTKVIKSVGHGCDEAAEKAVKSVKFTPGVMKGKNVEATVVIPIMFKLN